MDDAAVFTEFTVWTARLLAARGVPVRALAAGYEVFRELLPDAPGAGAILGQGLRQLR